MNRRIEYIKYKCSKCSKLFPFEEMIEVPEKFENGSIKTTYLCRECNVQIFVAEIIIQEYRCSKCGKMFPYDKVVEISKTKKGIIKISYLCLECYKL